LLLVLVINGFNFQREDLSIVIKVGIVGFGNVGRGVEQAIAQQPDMELVAIFTRRSPEDVKPYGDVKVDLFSNLHSYVGEIDVLLLCNGSANDLPIQGPEIAKMFCTVDSYDNHGKIFDYFTAMNEVATANGKICIIGTGWDPGLFSINRALFEACLPKGTSTYFYGPGVSQGHSQALRDINGIKNAVQYTMPVTGNLRRIQEGEILELTPRQKYTRDCYVVLEEGANGDEIEALIKKMPNYFEPYDTTVTFISEEELVANHFASPHGGFVIRNGTTGVDSHPQKMEFSLKLKSNPEFTAAVIVAYARAAARMHAGGEVGARTVLDVTATQLSPKTHEELIKELL